MKKLTLVQWLILVAAITSIYSCGNAVGKATGQIDDEAVHYIRSRGINKSDAKKLILHSFLTNIIKKVSLENLRVDLNNEIQKYLDDVN